MRNTGLESTGPSAVRGDGGAGLRPAGADAGQGRAIGVLVSGEGTNLQALVDRGLPIAAVASNRSGVRALERAAAAGIPGEVFELDRYEDRAARDRAMADWL